MTEEMTSGSETAAARPDFARSSLRSLRAAQRVVKRAEDLQASEQLQYMLAEANVYALLDLAEAIRGSGSGAQR